MWRAVVASVLVAVAAPAAARAEQVIRAEPSTRYTTPEVTIAPGETVKFDNADVVSHDVTSRQAKADGERLFASEILGAGKTGPVKGTADLQPGQYEFFCSLHSSMKGKLTVTGDPAPTPQPTPTTTPEPDTAKPEVTLKGTLRARPIRRRGRIELTVRSNEDVELTLVARIGRRRIGRLELDIDAGRRRIAIKLTRRRPVRRARRLRIDTVAVDKAGNVRRTRLVVKLP
jgi:plastocyanin